MKNEYEWWLAACVYFEARGEPWEGQVAIVQVVLNRVIRRKQSIREVITDDRQFSWYNGGVQPGIVNWKAFIKCMDAVDYAVCRRYDGDTFFDADHYHATYVHPSWAKEMKEVARIGKHIFYKS